MLSKMKLKIPFEEIKDAIEQASFEHYYLIDKNNHKIIFISEYEDDYEKKLERVNDDNFIEIPSKMLDEDFQVMQSSPRNLPLSCRRSIVNY